MLTFDAMSREVCTARREATSTPLQSLVLLNDPQFVEAARVLAEQVLKRYPDDRAARNREAFRSLIGRSPDATESGILARLFTEQRDLFANRPDVYDFHATLLRLLGIDHERLTYLYQGRRFRLTDVHGKVVDALLA
jgi:hypothetical protein